MGASGWLEVTCRCVSCGHAALELAADGNALQCVYCDESFPVLDDIPVVLPPALRTDLEPIDTDGLERLRTEQDTLRDRVAVANRLVYDERGAKRYAMMHDRVGTHRSGTDLAPLLSRLADHSPGDSCLVDLGSGDGQAALAAKSCFSTVIAVDISHRMLAETKRPGDGIVRICCAADQTPLCDESADAVIAFALLHHVVDLPRLFAEVLRVLRPEGLFYSAHDANGAFVAQYRRLQHLLHGRDAHLCWPGGLREALAEYRNTCGDLDKRTLEDALAYAGFCEFKVRPYVTPTRLGSLWRRLATTALRGMYRVWPSGHLGTHLSVEARKPPSPLGQHASDGDGSGH